MVKNRFLVFVAIVLGLTMVTSAMVARTYAKYTTTVTATAQLLWRNGAEGAGEGEKNEDFTFNLIETLRSGVAGTAGTRHKGPSH